jgi:hypothetical protein
MLNFELLRNQFSQGMKTEVEAKSFKNKSHYYNNCCNFYSQVLETHVDVMLIYII